MMLSLRAFPLIVLASLASVDAHTQDAAALLPPSTLAAKAMSSENGEPFQEGTPHGGLELAASSAGEIVLDSNGATRRELLARLFAGHHVEIEWRNKAYAEAKMQGRFRGLQAELARQLLASMNHIVTYDTTSNEPRLARIVILGSDPPSTAPDARAQTPAAPKPQPGEAWRRFQAIEGAKRAIAAALTR